jgi:hypothetical protein
MVNVDDVLTGIALAAAVMGAIVVVLYLCGPRD